MRGFVAEARERDVGAEFKTLIFCHVAVDAADWLRDNLCKDRFETRVLPGVAAPKNFFSGEFEVARTH